MLIIIFFSFAVLNNFMSSKLNRTFALSSWKCHQFARYNHNSRQTGGLSERHQIPPNRQNKNLYIYINQN